MTPTLVLSLIIIHQRYINQAQKSVCLFVTRLSEHEYIKSTVIKLNVRKNRYDAVSEPRGVAEAIEHVQHHAELVGREARGHENVEDPPAAGTASLRRVQEVETQPSS